MLPVLLICSSLCAQENKLDSLRLIVEKSKTSGNIDTAIFNNALARIEQITLNDAEIEIVENMANALYEEGNIYWSSTINYSIITSLSLSDKKKAINFGKRCVDRLENNTSLSYLALRSGFLKQLRFPYRNSSYLPEGFQYFNQKIKDYLLRNDSCGLSDCYYVIGGFYRTTGLMDQAVYNMKKSLQYMDTIRENDRNYGVNEKPNGRSSWINNNGVLGYYYMLMGEYSTALQYSSIPFREYQNHYLKNIATFASNIAYDHIMLGHYDSVKYFLDIAFKCTDSILDPAEYVNTLQVAALYKIKTAAYNEAEDLLQQCWVLIDKHKISVNPSAGTIAPDYYLALIRIEQNKIDEAIQLLIRDIARLNNERLAKLRDYKLLAELYERLNHVEKAKDAYKYYILLKDSLLSDQNKYRSLSFELEQQMSANENTMIALKNENKIASMSRNYSAGIAILLLLIAAGIYARFRTKLKANAQLEEKNKSISEEKLRSDELLKKSDELLLNILPVEVAEEIKQYGFSKAKTYSMVTVMFTDFKDFTTVSGKVSAELLVDEINYCFSAFDNIVQRHNIEKIKTVGDAYICVGGMPALTFTHATDILETAFEIRDFMLQRKKEKEAKGELPFELRIGIHTGPVVAGIVGVKKFAYDIWGDTVNLAARMEQNCEAGKINISGSTYDLVKDSYDCLHRGKIEAKNKGEVDMYFVERRSVHD